jgi:hypothetical protein
LHSLKRDLEAVLDSEFVGDCFPGFSRQSPLVNLI